MSSLNLYLWEDRSKRSVSKKHRQDKKKRRDVNPPSDSDPSSDSSDDDSSSESSEDSSDEDAGVNLTTASATQAGTTLLTFRPYINSNTLGEFDTKASLRERELKLKLPGAARDWFNQLPKHTQRDWKELASAFRKKNCKARSSYSERYFTMEMKNSESALDFFYRLNSAAGKADIDFHNDPDPKKRDVAMVHGAVNDCRTKVLLDTGATVNIVSFDLARKLGLRLKSHKQTKISGMGGVPTYIGSSPSVLLGMSFMFAAGVRIGIREGLVTLLDEETIVMCGWNPEERLGVDMPVETTSSWYLAPGESKVVKISNGLTNPQREVVWAGRGDHWVTRLIYAAKSWPVAVKVVNISDKDVWIDNRTPVARIVEYGFFPRAGRFVRPGSFAYREWQTLILENIQLREGRIRAERLAALEPPCVDTPKYPKPKIRRVRFAEDASTQTDEVPPEGFRESQDMTVDMNGLGNNSLTDEVSSTASPVAETPGLGVEINSDSQGWRDEEGNTLDSVIDDDDSLNTVEEYWDIPISGMPGTPLEKLKQEYDRCMRLSTEDLDYEPAVYMREGSELLSQLRDQLVMLPEIKDLTPECKIEEADVGVPGRTTPEMEDQVRRILEYHRKIFLGDGNAAPPPARGVVCDLDVGDAKPVAQRPRSVAPHLWTKVYELLKKLLENGLIETSTSPWASPIVIVLKKNGVDIRMCIDYRVVNSFIKLSHYPLPLIDDLLIGFESAMWFMSLDMASGFWAIKMTERAKLISAFVCPYGHYQWVRMPFGLKNAPLIYQAVLNNCLWGFLRLPPEEEAEVDQDVLHFLGLNSGEPRVSSGSVPHFSALTDEMTVFQRNIPAPSQMGPVLGRSSYIDDIAHGAPTWEQLCQDLNALLFRLRYWNISVSLPKSEFEKLSIPYLSHEISAEGIRAIPKIAKGVKDLPFPTTLKGVQSFMGSLNYYNKFIEDLPVIAAVLYELTEEQMKSRRDLSRAQEAFEILKHKIVSTPLLRHPDRSRPFVIIPHVNPWAASAVLSRSTTGSYTRVLEVFRILVEGSPKIVVYTRYSVLKWLLTSQVQRDEDGLAAILGAGITPREHLDEVAENLIPAKGRVKPPVPISIEMLEADYEGYILSFDGAAKTSTRQGSCGCILWRLLGWENLDAQGFILGNVTVNDAEYHGLLKGLTLAIEQGVQDIVVVGDSRIAIQQAQGLINCNQPNLQRKLAEYEVLKTKFKSVRLVHVKREFNQAADYLTSKTLALGESWKVEDADERTHLQLVSKIHEKLVKPKVLSNAGIQKDDPQVVETLNVPGPECAPLPAAAKVLAVITRAQPQESQIQGEPMGPLEYQAERWRRIKVHQDKDDYLLQLKDFLRGNTEKLSHAQARKLAKVADDFVLDSRE
ncbi:Aspartic protease, partial [Phytophthora palmivora]